MGFLRRIENGLEGVFEGGIGRTFRSHVQPVELARKLAKEMDDHRTISVSQVYVPNVYTLYLAPTDREQFATYEASLRTELASYLGEHARREGYTVPGRIRVLIESAEELPLGSFGISVAMQEAPRARPAAKPRPNGRQATREGELPAEFMVGTDESSFGEDVPPVAPVAAAAVARRRPPEPDPVPSDADASLEDSLAGHPALEDPEASADYEPLEAAAAASAASAAVEAVEPEPAAAEAADPEADAEPDVAPDVAPPVDPEAGTELALPSVPDPLPEPDPLPDPLPDPVPPPIPDPVPPIPEPLPESRRPRPAPAPDTMVLSQHEAGARDLVREEWALTWPGGRFAIERRAIVLGRSRDCDVVLADTNVSRRHAELVRHGGGFVLRDLDSTNGSLVNGRRVREAPVTAGDVLTLGTTTLRLERKRT
jgi:hypothetical protein